MAGINLSQSIQEKQALARGRFFDSGLYINIAIFLVILAAWLGTSWYAGKLGTDVAALKAESDQKIAGMKSDEANEVKDLQVRLMAIDENLKATVEPIDALQDLEQFTIEPIKLTRYVWMQDQNSIKIEGEVTSLRFLAQQMLAYKKLKGASSVHVDSVHYNESGQIEFELRLSVVGSDSGNSAF